MLSLRWRSLKKSNISGTLGTQMKIPTVQSGTDKKQTIALIRTRRFHLGWANLNNPSNCSHDASDSPDNESTQSVKNSDPARIWNHINSRTSRAWWWWLLSLSPWWLLINVWITTAWSLCWNTTLLLVQTNVSVIAWLFWAYLSSIQNCRDTRFFKKKISFTKPTQVL